MARNCDSARWSLQHQFSAAQPRGRTSRASQPTKNNFSSGCSSQPPQCLPGVAGSRSCVGQSLQDCSGKASNGGGVTKPMQHRLSGNSASHPPPRRLGVASTLGGTGQPLYGGHSNRWFPRELLRDSGGSGGDAYPLPAGGRHG
mmetsp:Transcript_92486/g.257639  ORF Transcript_92486/g.257639 Transcript_92486/m.257639 type:complete len:144 (+) Transcript_92486:1003-1434(+)